jgi:hypothetical protein
MLPMRTEASFNDRQDTIFFHDRISALRSPFHHTKSYKYPFIHLPIVYISVSYTDIARGT